MIRVRVDRVVIVADDLTGALDTAAVLRRQGFGACVVLDAAQFTSSGLLPFDVLAITTETRHLAAPEPVLGRLVPMLPPESLVYKKIDSTLRGAIGAELVALLDNSPAHAALVVPALPAQGRALVHGHLVVDGVTCGPHLPALLHRQT